MLAEAEVEWSCGTNPHCLLKWKPRTLADERGEREKQTATARDQYLRVWPYTRVPTTTKKSYNLKTMVGTQVAWHKEFWWNLRLSADVDWQLRRRSWFSSLMTYLGHTWCETRREDQLYVYRYYDGPDVREIESRKSCFVAFCETGTCFHTWKMVALDVIEWERSFFSSPSDVSHCTIMRRRSKADY